MSIIETLKPPPSKYKVKLQKHGLPATAVAKYLGFSYPYTLNLLNGVSRISPVIDRKLQLLIKQLETQTVDSYGLR